MYADRITAAIDACLRETKRRRKIQNRYNEENGITPESIKKSITDILSSVYESDYVTVPGAEEAEEVYSEKELLALIRKLKKEMAEAARDLEFERAAEIRDRILKLSGRELEFGGE